MSWDDYGYGRTDSIDECYVSGDGYTDMYGNMGHGYGYSDFGRPFPPLQNPPYYGGVYGNHSLVPFPPASQHVPLSPFLRKEKRRMPPAMESPAPIPPKKPKSIRNHQAEFEAYLLELPEEHREVAKTLAEQLKSFKSGRLRLPDQEFVPVPVELLPTTETALLDEEIKIDAGCMETAFHHGADTVKMGLISLSPWPEASSLKEINQHPNKDQVPLDIIESLKNEDNIGPLCFGRLVGEELKKIEAHKRVDVARRIMMALTTSTNHVGPPDTKKRRLDQS